MAFRLPATHRFQIRQASMLETKSPSAAMRLPFVNHLGLVIEEAASGKSRCVLEVREIHMNSSGIVHGAALFALVDTGMGAALFSTLDSEHGCATIEAKINYFKPVHSGAITCTSDLSGGRNGCSGVRYLFRFQTQGRGRGLGPVNTVLSTRSHLKKQCGQANSPWQRGLAPRKNKESSAPGLGRRAAETCQLTLPAPPAAPPRPRLRRGQ
ncbi:MAG: hypothetical protein C0453_05410 [Comamonadaceae bacterium]|nr:hypothetical protein [Comamonadaceae bacterium]